MRRSRLLRSLVQVIGCSALLTAGISGMASATDINIDYSGSNNCGTSYGGAALVLDGWVTPDGTGGNNNTPYYINNPYTQYSTDFDWCTDTNGSPITIVSWANLPGAICIDPGAYVHVGVSASGSSFGVVGAFFYNNDGTNDCTLATNLTGSTGCDPSSYDEQCGFVMAPTPASPLALGGRRLSPLAAKIKYKKLTLLHFDVHTDGKTLTIKNKPTWPPVGCVAPMYIRHITFSYFASRQPLRTLNADSLHTPMAADTVRGGPWMIACSDSVNLTVPDLPPVGARAVVVSAIVDTAASFASPARSHVWQQEALASIVPAVQPVGLVALECLLGGLAVAVLYRRRRAGPRGGAPTQIS